MIKQEEFTLRFLLQRFVVNGPLNADQERWLEEYESPERIIHLDGDRASGRTTFGLGVIAVESFLNSNQSVMVVCKSGGSLASCRRQIDAILDSIAQYFKIENLFLVNNKTSIKLSNESVIRFSPDASHNFRGLSLTLVFLDFNCELMERIDDELIAVTLPSIAKCNGRLMVSL